MDVNMKLFPFINIFQKEKENNNQTHSTAILFTVCAGETLCMLDSLNRISKPIWSCKLQGRFVYFCRCASGQMHCDTLCCTHNKTVSGESTCGGKLKCFIADKVHQAALFPSLFVGLLEELKPGWDSQSQRDTEDTTITTSFYGRAAILSTRL